MLATAKAAIPKTQKYLKPHGTSGFRHYGANGHCIKDGMNIDPPYNTGNEGWIYNDNVNAPRIKKWWERRGKTSPATTSGSA